MEIPEHLTCLLRNLYAGQEATVRPGHLPTPVLLGESNGQRSLAGYSPRGRKESDMTQQLHFHFHAVKGFSIVSETEIDVNGILLLFL